MKQLILLVPIILLAGCQAMMEEHRRQMAVLCTYEGAYSAGVQDVQNGEASRAMQRLSGCPGQTLQQAMRGYNDGYAQINSQPATLGGVIGQVFDHAVSANNVHTCEISVFTDTFTGTGRTRNEALFNAKSQCRNSRHDGDFFCKKNADYTCSQTH